MTGTMMRLLALARPAAGRLVLATLAGVGATGCAIGLMAASAWLISRAAQHPPVLHLTVAIVAVRASALGRAGLRYVERLTGHDAALRVLGEVRVREYASLERLAPVGLVRARAGDVVSRFVSDMDSAVDVITRFVLPYLVVVLAGVATAAFVASLLPAVGAILLVGLLVACAGVPAIQAVVARREDRRTAQLRGELTGQVVELLHGAPDLVAYGAGPERLEGIAETDRRLRWAAARASTSVGLGGALVAMTAGACVWAALALGTPAVRDGTLAGVLLAVIVLVPLAVFEAVATLPAAAAQLGLARSALRRVFDILDRPAPIEEAGQPAQLPPPPYHLRLENVTARWADGAPDAVTALDLDLTPGGRVALVGPTGGGKSTVAALLVRFLDPVNGRVTINGVDLRRLAIDDVRRVVGLVAEDAYVFDTTIEQNVRIGRPDATTDEIRAALAAARLLDWVDGLPAGLATALGERGGRLSGGQRRRLVLARALLADFPVLVLDEPTEHLDRAAAAAITADLLATSDRTVLLITHDLYGLSFVDAVVHLTPTPARP